MKIKRSMALGVTAIALLGMGNSHAESENNGQQIGSPEQARIMEQSRQREKARASADDSADSPYSYGDWDSGAVETGPRGNTRFGVGWESRMGVDVNRSIDAGSGVDAGLEFMKSGGSAGSGSAAGGNAGGHGGGRR